MLNLYPTEQKEIKRIVSEEMKRFRENYHRLNATNDFQNRITDRIGKLGLIAIVNVDPTDPGNYDLAGDDETLVFVPQIDIISRIGGEQAVDFDRMQHESKKQSGYEILPDGTKREYK